jgi:transposase InsO family protein
MEFTLKGRCSVYKALLLIGLSRSSYYYRSRKGRPGRKPSTTTRLKSGTLSDNNDVLKSIQKLLSHPYVDYGYRKVTMWLRMNGGYVINSKKVIRLMRENNLMLPRRKSALTDRNWVKITVPQPDGPFQYLEMDIKYIYIHGARKNAFLLSIVDLFHRQWLGYELGFTMTKHRVKLLIDRIISLSAKMFSTRSERILFTLRTDNGSQFASHLIREYLKSQRIFQEFTRPATPQQNGHIESFHSILQNALIDRFEFESYDGLNNQVDEFYHFYNQERLHSAICFLPPLPFLARWQAGEIGIRQDAKNRNQFFFRKAEPQSPASPEESLLVLTQC